MNHLSHRFMLVAIAAGAAGMGLGLGMGVTQDFRLAPAHAHLNLLGWVSMFLYGLFYRSEPHATRGMLPQLHFWLAAAGLAVMIPALALALLGYGTAPIVAFGAMLTIVALLVFAAVALRSMRRPDGWANPPRGSERPGAAAVQALTPNRTPQGAGLR